MKQAIIEAEPAKQNTNNRKNVRAKIGQIETEAKKISSVKGTKAAKDFQSEAFAQNTKSKAKKNQPVVAADANVETSKVISPVLKRRAAKSVSSIPIQKANGAETASTIAARTAKPKTKKDAQVLAAAVPSAEIRRVKSAVSSTNSELKTVKGAVTAEAQNVKLKTKKAIADAPAAKPQLKSSKIKPEVFAGKNRIIAEKIQLPNAIPAGKSKRVKIMSPPQNVKAAEDSSNESVETTAAPRRAKPKKTKPIGAAVFRGRRGRYDFQVYAIDAEFENIPAIYIISKRKTDKNKRAHHALVCIGQTDSISGELKKHTKSKCVAKHQANVISILPEANEKKRLKIEEDLRAAHAIACRII